MNTAAPPWPHGLIKIISGGQTGADRAALDWAIAHRLAHGGWCPKGRWAEDGAIPQTYQLRETPLARLDQRTEWNVREADATVIFSVASALEGGALLTHWLVQRHHKPCLHLAQADTTRDHPTELRAFLARHAVRVLNVAGPRASKEPGVAGFVRSTLEAALAPAR